jgi:hypothetical protein
MITKSIKYGGTPPSLSVVVDLLKDGFQDFVVGGGPDFQQSGMQLFVDHNLLFPLGLVVLDFILQLLYGLNANLRGGLHVSDVLGVYRLLVFLQQSNMTVRTKRTPLFISNLSV